MHALTAIPVYNERRHVAAVLEQVRIFAHDILVVDDGSTDGTQSILDRFGDVKVIHHAVNRGYGAALISAFEYAIEHDYDVVVTLDCDGQHQPQRIPLFVQEAETADIVSGSRYLQHFAGDDAPPAERRWINRLIANDLHNKLELQLSDAFCGFKAYRVDALKRLTLTEPGYAMPLELWVQAASQQLSVVELPVPLIYFEEERSFGGPLDDSETRLNYYQSVIERAIDDIRAAGVALDPPVHFTQEVG